MKTIDEVIKALEICTDENRGCAGCPFDDDCERDDDRWVDALHYLKEYKAEQEKTAALPDYYELVKFWSENHEDIG